jgi:hypothetical protein
VGKNFIAVPTTTNTTPQTREADILANECNFDVKWQDKPRDPKDTTKPDGTLGFISEDGKEIEIWGLSKTNAHGVVPVKVRVGEQMSEAKTVKLAYLSDETAKWIAAAVTSPFSLFRSWAFGASAHPIPSPASNRACSPPFFSIRRATPTASQNFNSISGPPPESYYP